MTPAHETSARATTILHVDMDAFFAAVEALDDPSLAGLPLVVGGDGPRGVVASCSYEARAFGVRSAMPSTEARRRCPAAVFVPARHGRYGEVSDELHRVLHEVTPLVEGIALDEAFLDVAGAVRLLGPPPEIAARLRERVEQVLRLSCSVGVARTKLLAKLASREAKPRADREGVRPGRGVVVVEPDEELAFLHPLPVRALWGVGPRTAERLARYGLNTVGDLAEAGAPTLSRLLGQAQGSLLAELCWARDPRAVEPSRPLRSVGHEETFDADIHGHEALRRHALRMADSVAGRLRRAGVSGRTVVVKVRFGDFSTITRSRTLPLPTTSAPVIADVAGELLEQVEVGGGVRLLGVSVSGLTTGEAAGVEQLSFDVLPATADPARDRPSHGSAGPDQRSVPRDLEAQRDLDDAVDAVRRRFGSGAVGPASISRAAGEPPGAPPGPRGGRRVPEPDDHTR